MTKIEDSKISFNPTRKTVRIQRPDEPIYNLSFNSERALYHWEFYDRNAKEHRKANGDLRSMVTGLKLTEQEYLYISGGSGVKLATALI